MIPTLCLAILDSLCLCLSRMSASRSQLNELKKTLRQGTVSTALRFLNENLDVHTIRTFREQKLLLMVRDLVEQEKLATAYKKAANHILTQTDASRAGRFASFTVALTKKSYEMSLQANERIQVIRSLSPIELLEVASDVTQEYFAQTRQSLFQYWEELQAKADRNNITIPELSDLTECALHQTHGATNDIGFAVARALNTTIALTDAKKKRTSGKRVRSAARDEFVDLVHLAGDWNSLEYAADMVSYGEWFVEDFRQGASQEIVFAFSDTTLAHAKTIGLRRFVARSNFGRERPRVLSKLLEDFALSAISAGIRFYKGRSPASFSQLDFEDMRSRVRRWLDLLDAEDELLLAVAEKDRSILAYYLAAIALRGFVEAAKFVMQHVAKKHRKGLTCPRVPVDEVVELVSNMGAPRDLVRAVVETQLLELPASRHFDIVSKPFIRLSTELVVALKPFAPGNWPTTVRAALVRGGHLAHSYGEIWETFVADTLQGFGWTILERGVKIRRNHQVLTDVDILALGQGLLLVIQFKAVSGSGVNTYEHWKTRRVIVKGAEQASIAAREIRDNPHLLVSLLSSKRVTQAVEHIQPVVITTSPLFTGWSYKDVPIISGGYLMSLLSGAKVEFKRQDYSTASEQRFAAGNEPTSEEFLQLLKSPFDWQMAGESDNIRHHWVDLGDMRMAFPILRRDITGTT